MLTKRELVALGFTDARGLSTFWDDQAGAWRKNNGVRIELRAQIWNRRCEERSDEARTVDALLPRLDPGVARNGGRKAKGGTP